VPGGRSTLTTEAQVGPASALAGREKAEIF